MGLEDGLNQNLRQNQNQYNLVIQACRQVSILIFLREKQQDRVRIGSALSSEPERESVHTAAVTLRCLNARQCVCSPGNGRVEQQMRFGKKKRPTPAVQ